jgi:hypothetical protein
VHYPSTHYPNPPKKSEIWGSEGSGLEGIPDTDRDGKRSRPIGPTAGLQR